jgi:ABC-2 type transport system permease protein
MNDAIPLFVRAMLARAYPRVIGLWREPTWVVQETVLPVLSASAYAFVYVGMDAPTYVALVFLGMAMTAFWLNVLWSMGAQFYWERDSGHLELYIMAPAPVTAVLAGMALGGMAMTTTRAVVILLAGFLLFGVAFHPTNWLGLAAVVVLTLLALYGLGMCFASAFLLWGREAWHIVNLFQEPVYLFSGLNYPVRTLGYAVAVAAGLIPMTFGMDALRQLLFPTPPFPLQMVLPLMPWPWEVAVLAGQVVLFLALARWLLGVLERKARQAGTLSLKGQ